MKSDRKISHPSLTTKTSSTCQSVTDAFAFKFKHWTCEKTWLPFRRSVKCFSGIWFQLPELLKNLTLHKCMMIDFSSIFRGIQDCTVYVNWINNSTAYWKMSWAYLRNRSGFHRCPWLIQCAEITSIKVIGEWKDKIIWNRLKCSYTYRGCY